MLLITLIFTRLMTKGAYLVIMTNIPLFLSWFYKLVYCLSLFPSTLVLRWLVFYVKRRLRRLTMSSTLDTANIISTRWREIHRYLISFLYILFVFILCATYLPICPGKHWFLCFCAAFLPLKYMICFVWKFLLGDDLVKTSSLLWKLELVVLTS